MATSIPRVAFFLYAMHGGGIERIIISLLKELVKLPIHIDLVLCEKAGALLYQVPSEVRVVELPDEKTSGRLRRVFPLARYLRQERPTVLLSHLTQYNIIAPIAKLLANIPLRVILVEHLSFLPLESRLKGNPQERIGLVNFLRVFFYRRTDVVAAVSQGLARELETSLKLKPGKVKVIYNPVVDETLFFKAEQPVNDPWFQAGQPPVFLGAGRLVLQKDFLTLIQAFAVLRQKYNARLVILGEGDELETLRQEISHLNLDSDISLPGFTNNPYAYMRRATAFVLSSQFEALPTVLIEALACGCHVISTDCPYGPREILQSGRFGKLVPVGDVKALAVAMEQAINEPQNPEYGRLRANDFSVEKAVSQYFDVMNIQQF